VPIEGWQAGAARATLAITADLKQITTPKAEKPPEAAGEAGSGQ
jgi:hypothetical protein